MSKKCSRSVAKEVECAQNDFTAYVLAKGLGKKNDTKKYLKRSQSWQTCTLSALRRNCAWLLITGLV